MVSILKGDCLQVMKGLQDKSISCFICDLPYGCLTGGGGQEKKKRRNLVRYEGGVATDKSAVYRGGVISGCPWDVKIDLEEFWVQVKRLAKDDHTPVLMFCNTKFGYDLIKSNESWFRYDIVWAKTNAVGFLRANKAPMTSHEMIYVFSKKGAFYRRIDTPGDVSSRCVTSVVSAINKKEKGGHPTAKPIELYEWLLKRYVPENGTIMDPTAGSFNCIFAAKALNMKAIGIEKDDEFFNKAIKKLLTV